MSNKTNQILDELIERYPILESQKDNIFLTCKVLYDAFSKGNKLLIAGNGGSAADAEHIVGELMKGFVKSRELSKELKNKLVEVDSINGEFIGERLQQGLPAIALTNHQSLNTAFMNDCDPNLTFAQQILGYGKENDVFLAISTSGNSKNILYACTVAKALNMNIVGLAGKDGGKLARIADISIVVPEYETYKIQELHLPIYHALCLMLEGEIFNEELNNV